ncbi:MAG TPA: adenylosuccinate synthetase [Anaerolineales bacterium]
MDKTKNTAILIADLGYGDAGKGSIVDYLTRTTGAHTVVRYNGGAQAAHNVIAPDGRHHTFAQFGSGTFVPGTRTHLSRFMMVHPLAMLAEERHLRSLGISDAFNRVSIDREALVTTPFQQSANRLKEIARGDGRHGSCGMGVGETMSDWLTYGSQVLFAGDLSDRPTTFKKLNFLRDAKIAQLEMLMKNLSDIDPASDDLNVLYDPGIVETTADIYKYFSELISIVEPSYLREILNEPGTTIFEGAQGVLLDEWYGFYPYNSWSTLTFKNADSLLRENDFAGETIKLGLVRAYATRHGAGPFVTEDEALTAQVQDYHNQNNDWQRGFRVGYLDFVAVRYALAVTGKIDGLVITNLDRMDAIPAWRMCELYKYVGDQVNAAEYFDLQDSSIRDIKVPSDPTNLIKQEELTKLLLDMRPIYMNCQKNKNAYIEFISRKLNIPVAIISAGPTALEKDSFFSFSKLEAGLYIPSSMT